ncbi:TIGR04104 family putative zinc finger protein [Salibacterium salarium]
MKIQSCVNCKRQFSWREQAKSTRNLFKYPEIECSNCREINKITIPFYILQFFVRAIPVSVLFFLLKSDISNGNRIIIFLICAAITLYIEPFLVKYKKIEK